MFRYKLDILQEKVKKFCYAGLWTLYVDLGTGKAKPCYGQMCNQNIFENPNDEIKFEPVGKHCRQPYCYNGHAFLTLGVVPEYDSPTYTDIRNRVCEDGTEWLKDDLKEAFSSKLSEANEIWSEEKKKNTKRNIYWEQLKQQYMIVMKFVKRYLRRNRGFNIWILGIKVRKNNFNNISTIILLIYIYMPFIMNILENAFLFLQLLIILFK